MTSVYFLFSRFIGPFLAVVQRLEQALASIRNILDEWVNVQAKWLYLEGVFIGGDIREQLPDEAKKFDDIDRSFIRVIRSLFRCQCGVKQIKYDYPQLTVACGKNPEALPFGEAHSAAEFEAINMNLDKCQKSLTEYLDSKRLKFPRFYFISKEDLLCILGNSDPKSIQEHLIKVKNDLKNKSNLISNTLFSFQMFDNIKSLKLSRDQFDVPCAAAMISSEGEQMIFRKPGKKIYE